MELQGIFGFCRPASLGEKRHRRRGGGDFGGDQHDGYGEQEDARESQLRRRWEFVSISAAAAAAAAAASAGGCTARPSQRHRPVPVSIQDAVRLLIIENPSRRSQPPRSTTNQRRHSRATSSKRATPGAFALGSCLCGNTRVSRPRCRNFSKTRFARTAATAARVTEALLRICGSSPRLPPSK